jgi:hypothetical protein
MTRPVHLRHRSESDAGGQHGRDDPTEAADHFAQSGWSDLVQLDAIERCRPAWVSIRMSSNPPNPDPLTIVVATVMP